MSGQSYRSGFISIVGSPNVGKSTLTNAFIGQKVSIVSERAQTTRNRIMGVMTRSGYQSVFLDTPGVTTPKNRLGEYMLKSAYETLNEVDAVVLVIDATRGVGPKDEALIARLASAKAPVIAVINKVDVSNLVGIEEIEEYLSHQVFIKRMFRISAMKRTGLAELERALSELLPEGPQYFPPNMITDMPERVILGEIIREKALNMLRQEIPHGVGVFIDKIEYGDTGICNIWATIYCERNSHKGIIIGRQGSMLKRIASDARKDMEWLLGCRINLQVWVKVKEDWRNSLSVMRELGYE